ncbi:4'-phosphopantetheinyl transferase family protein [Clostridium beijerinckii]|uniref:4'-phosphopantetheinyl transferase family protein n=1 Tax=Clostridium beijerinckii TaxID=1520 RepID=UPI0022E6FC9E|nr:4'-phosphopantetheinyl transferase superfamily protein [Clostridium beijerinckii]
MYYSTEVYALKIDKEFNKKKFCRLINFVSAEKRECISKFYSYEDCLRSLLGNVLVRYLLCKRLNIMNKDLLFKTNDYGKTYLSNFRDTYFNISHSLNWVVSCIDVKAVGIDIEFIKPINIQIAKRFFTSFEYNFLMSKSITEREAYFYELWTLKESYIKARGMGMAMPLNSFAICINEHKINIKTKFKNYNFHQYNIDENYKLSVCSQNEYFANKVQIIDINELYYEILKL